MNIVVISSSVREERNTHKVAKFIAKSIEDAGEESTILDLKQYPLPPLHYTYNGHPNPTNEMKVVNNILTTADAFVFVSPEYNGSYAPALKMLVDYYAKGPFAGKAIGVATVSVGGMAGMRAAQIMQLLVMGVFGYPSPNMLLTGGVNSKFDADDNVIDDKYKEQVGGFAKEIISLGGALANKV